MKIRLRNGKMELNYRYMFDNGYGHISRLSCHSYYVDMDPGNVSLGYSKFNKHQLRLMRLRFG